ncbi:MAG: M12 family metallopeptidase [Bdellovibrionota bacterium]
MIPIFIAGLVLFFWLNRNKTPAPKPEHITESVIQERIAPPPKPETLNSTVQQKQTIGTLAKDNKPSRSVKVMADKPLTVPKGNSKELVLPFVMDEGVAVIMGDVVIGAPVEGAGVENGVALIPPVKVWPTNRIPFHIQDNVQNPERIYKALAMFEGTAVQFIPYSGQNDAIVFEDSNGICKSYVGYVGGKQPIWLPPGCGPSEIAHEILHALGFVHEQNRSDRDKFIKVMPENIDEKYANNFEKLPYEYSKATEVTPFDFQSIMIYPTWMFAKSALPTMQSLKPGSVISPGENLSVLDIDRINELYTRE